MNPLFNVRQPTADVHRFAMSPRADIPRSQFRMQHTHKTTINASWLVPIFLTEVLPGDSFKCNMTAFCRLATPLFPIMDNMRLETFFFFVPNRLVWSHWAKFCGEQDNPGDSISFSIPQTTSPTNGWAAGSLADYFGLPTAGQVGIGNTITHSCLPFRCYMMIYHEWFRDENLINGTWIRGTSDGDGPDPNTTYNQTPLFRGKRHDYFTSCLPWTQKGGVPVTIPFTGNATVKASTTELLTGTQTAAMWRDTGGALPTPAFATTFLTSGGHSNISSVSTTAVAGGAGAIYPSNLFADLSTVAAVTINALRLAFQTQKLLERDARGGTRYTEIIRSHFGVMSPDARLQRPEYLGGGRTPIVIAPVAQTSATGLTGGTTPTGNLAAVGTALAKAHGFRQSFTEHGHIIGLACVTADLTYQQGQRRLWARQTRYDFYWPVLALLGEQAVLNKEIFQDGSVNDTATFGYQERWAEYRYMPSLITGNFRSTASAPLDAWHLAQKFSSLPALNSTFILDSLQPTLDRNLALGGTARTSFEQLICDFFFDMLVARPMPMYSVPGMIDHL